MNSQNLKESLIWKSHFASFYGYSSAPSPLASCGVCEKWEGAIVLLPETDPSGASAPQPQRRDSLYTAEVYIKFPKI
jgi:hypothetical protein